MIKNKFKKITLVIVVLLLLILFINIGTTLCADNTYTDCINNILNNANMQLNNINFDEINNILVDNNISLIPDFKSTVEDILTGSYFLDYNGLLRLILDIIKSSIGTIIPTVVLIIAIAILGNITSSVSNDNRETNKIINIIINSMLLIIIIINVKSTIFLCNKCINNITTQMDIVFPILLTMLVSVGGVSSASIYNPTIALISTLISKVFVYFLYPVFIVSLVFTILNNINSSIKLKKLNNFVSSLFKWTVGIVFTIFSALLTIQGISAGNHDSISFKTAKFAVKSYIPLIGGYLSDGLDFVVVACVLVKNAVGVVGVLVLIFTIISPILQIVILKLSLQFMSGVIEGVGDGKVSSMLEDVSKILIYPIVIILAVSFMYILMLTLFIMTANIV